MHVRCAIAALALVAAAGAHAAPSVLNAGTHADTYIAPAINAAIGSGHVDNPIYVDYDPAGPSSVLADSSNPSASLVSVASGLPANHATYQVLNASFCCFKPASDFANYVTLEGQSSVFAQPVAVGVGGQLPSGTAPPVLMVTASSSNSSDGGTGWGVEFALSASYLGLNTSEDSWDSAAVAGFLAALEYEHPTFNLFDVKGALRQTAGNWSTGYAYNAFGFGSIDFASANAVSSTSSIYLQGPGIAITNHGYYASITLYPFRQTRRAHEVVYSCTAGYSWPVKNEYALSDVTGGCGTLIYTSNGTDVTPTFTYAPVSSGTVTLIAFTTDGAGEYSRVEPYSPQSQSFLVGTACIAP